MTNQNDDLRRTDPGFAERMLHFADVEVAQDPDTALDPQTRYLAILATLLGCQGTDEFRIQLARALDAGLTPVQVKEVVYQAVDYLGIGRVRPVPRHHERGARSTRCGAAAARTREGEHRRGQQRRPVAQSRAAMPAVHRLPAHAQCAEHHRRGGTSGRIRRMTARIV